MCLYINKKIKVKFTNGRIIAYKAFHKPYKALVSPYQGKKYKPGWCKSNSIKSTKYDKIVILGIHVHLTKESAENAEPLSIIVPVICYEKDFIAAGSSWYDKSLGRQNKNKEAVFTKVFLCKKDFLKAMDK